MAVPISGRLDNHQGFLRPLTFLLGMCGICCFIPMHAWAKDPITIHDVFEAWRQREAAVQGAHFTWTERNFVVKGTRDGKLERDDRSKDAQIDSHPDQDVEFQVVVSLKLKKNLVRYKRDGLAWSVSDGRFLPTHYEVVYSGEGSTKTIKNSKVDEGGDPVDGRKKFGIETEGRYIADFHGGMRVHPVVLFLRGGNERDGLRESDWDLSPLRVPFRGQECLVLKKKRNRPPFEEHYWVDPAKGYVVVRRVRHYQGRVVTQLDVEYREDPFVRWVPVSWHALLYSRGHATKAGLEQEFKANVTHYELNPQWSPDAFAFDYPPGAHVTYTNKDRETSVYIVTDDGKKRWFSPEETRTLELTDYQSYLAATRREPSQRRSVQVVWILGILVGVLALIVASARWGRRKRSPLA